MSLLGQQCVLSVGSMISEGFLLVGSVQRPISFGPDTRTFKYMQREYITWLEGGSNLLSLVSVNRSESVGTPYVHVHANLIFSDLTLGWCLLSFS